MYKASVNTTRLYAIGKAGAGLTLVREAWQVIQDQGRQDWTIFDHGHDAIVCYRGATAQVEPKQVARRVTLAELAQAAIREVAAARKAQVGKAKAEAGNESST